MLIVKNNIKIMFLITIKIQLKIEKHLFHKSDEMALNYDQINTSKQKPELKIKEQ